MKIMVISDTHGQLDNPIKVLRHDSTFTHVIHLGDTVADARDLQNIFFDKSFCMVKGNNDIGEQARESLLLNLCGHNIFAAHGHRFGVKGGIETFAAHAGSLGCTLALFGHTHVCFDAEVYGVRCINPSNKGYFEITDDYIKFFKY